MKLSKALNRDRKHHKNRYGHQRDGDSVKVIERIQKKRADKVISRMRKQKQDN